MEYFSEHGGFTCLNMSRRQSLRARCDAIRTLVRPNEVNDLARDVRYLARAASLHKVTATSELLRELNLAYYPDIDDEWCSPGVTLLRGGGDCDDHAILATALLRRLGINAWVILGWVPGGYHAWVLGLDPVHGWFTMEPQGGRVWWGRFARDYSPEYVLGPDGCWAWHRWVARLNRRAV